jgi:hypothetical protein
VATALLIRAAGFQINAIETGYMTGPKPWTFRVGDELISRWATPISHDCKCLLDCSIALPASP